MGDKNEITVSKRIYAYLVGYVHIGHYVGMGGIIWKMRFSENIDRYKMDQFFVPGNRKLPFSIISKKLLCGDGTYEYECKLINAQIDEGILITHFNPGETIEIHSGKQIVTTIFMHDEAVVRGEANYGYITAQDKLNEEQLHTQIDHLNHKLEQLETKVDRLSSYISVHAVFGGSLLGVLTIILVSYILIKLL